MAQPTKAIAIINTTAPFSSVDGKEALDVAMIFGSYEQNTSLFFIGDGVYQLCAKQQPGLIEHKDYLKTFAALTFYDIDNIYLCQQSLEQRGLAANFHIENVQVLAPHELGAKLQQHQAILRF